MEVHWYEAYGILGKKEMKRKSYLGKTHENAQSRFVVCVDNSEYLALLELHTLYRSLPDADVNINGDIRIIDEGGDDYLYPAGYFIAAETQC